MLYVPNKFLFIHIPRSAGNAVTRTLAEELVSHRDIVVGTSHGAILWRHMPVWAVYKNLQIGAAERQRIQIVVIKRDEDEVIRSDWRLFKAIEGDIKQFEHHPFYHKLIAARESYGAFRQTWDVLLDGKSMVDWWCPPQYWPWVIPYEQLDDHWPDLCKAAGCESVPTLLRTDFQLVEVKRQRFQEPTT